ncbi:MAG: hypothetical protein WCK32_00845 [Chlorobiaceae bacterium]
MSASLTRWSSISAAAKPLNAWKAAALWSPAPIVGIVISVANVAASNSGSASFASRSVSARPSLQALFSSKVKACEKALINSSSG